VAKVVKLPKKRSLVVAVASTVLKDNVTKRRPLTGRWARVLDHIRRRSSELRIVVTSPARRQKRNPGWREPNAL
jgi:hypothetical protein